MRATFVAAAVAVLVVAGGALRAGDELTRPAPAASGGPAPGLDVEPLAFRSESNALLAAWFSPGAQGGGAILLLHAVRSNEHAMLPRARFLNAQGFAVLAIDLQAHAESEGERITFGYREAAEVRAAVARLREVAPGERIGALGISLGGAAPVLASPHPPIDAAVLESVYPTIEDAVSNAPRDPLRGGRLLARPAAPRATRTPPGRPRGRAAADRARRRARLPAPRRAGHRGPPHGDGRRATAVRGGRETEHVLRSGRRRARGSPRPRRRRLRAPDRGILLPPPPAAGAVRLYSPVNRRSRRRSRLVGRPRRPNPGSGSRLRTSRIACRLARLASSSS